MSDDFEPLRHEAGDRAFVVSQHFADFVADHPFVAKHPALKQLADKIADDLAELYQAIWKTESGSS